MPDFQYIARDAAGNSQAGSIAAQTRSSAATQLREKGWVVLKVDATQEADDSSTSMLLKNGFPPRSIHVEISLQQLAMMLRSGMTLLESIRATADQSSRKSLARVWDQVSHDIQRGKGLSEAMSAHSCLPGFVLRLVQVGERTGNLPAVLGRASDTMKHRRMARESFVSATIYPVIVVMLSVFVTAYMIVYLIPRLETYLQSLGRQMPGMTQGLIDASFWLRGNFQFILIGSLFLVFAAAAIYQSADGRRWIDRMLLHLPGVGRLVRLGETATFARGLSMMLKSGITVTDGLLAVENTLGNHHLRHTVVASREKLIRGSNLVDALNEKQTFTPLLRQMVAVGEKSGELAVVLDEVAKMSDQQFAAAVKRMNSIMTPALTLVVGGIVGYVYIAFFMALVAAGS